MTEFVDHAGKLMSIIIPIAGGIIWVVKEVRKSRLETQNGQLRMVEQLKKDSRKTHKAILKAVDSKVSKKKCRELRANCPCNSITKGTMQNEKR